MKPWRVPYPKFGSGLGLARVKAISAILDIDLASFGSNGAAITGSNGKGSTAAMLASILRQSGGPVGLFTSPHLFRLNERFAIDGEDISDDDLEYHWIRVAAAIETWRADNDEEVGGFEFLFLIAASCFAARGCRFTVWEAGIGGRYDPVRLIEARRIALTSLDLEHTALLGDTREAIASGKLDAAPRGGKAFISASCAPQRTYIESHCAERAVQAVWTASCNGSALSGEGASVTPTPGPAPQGGGEPPLFGAHQNQNAALAIALARDMAALTEPQIAAGLAATRWPGRLEIIETDPLIVIDVGHTPDAIAVARAGFEHMRSGRPAILVCGASTDKNADEIVAALAPDFTIIICAQPRHKGRPAAEIAARAGAHADAEIIIAESVAEARELALSRARRGKMAVYVAGGLFLAAEFKAAHVGIDPASLVFF